MGLGVCSSVLHPVSCLSCAVGTGLTVIVWSGPVWNDCEVPVQLFSKPAFTPYTKEQITYYKAGKQQICFLFECDSGCWDVNDYFRSLQLQLTNTDFTSGSLSPSFPPYLPLSLSLSIFIVLCWSMSYLPNVNLACIYLFLATWLRGEKLGDINNILELFCCGFVLYFYSSYFFFWF